MSRHADTPLDAWSRRRALVRAEAEEDRRREMEERAAHAQAALARRHADKSEDEVLEELGLCKPEDMGAGDDFAAFMRAAVPAHLRKRALRRLWLTDPMLANLDELVDYGEDYTAKAGAEKAVRTVYRIGKGLSGDAAPDEAAKGECAEQKAEELPEMAEAQAQAPVAPPDMPREEDKAEKSPLARPRRMRFCFDEDDDVSPSKEEATG